jgi:hypothetical protein
MQEEYSMRHNRGRIIKNREAEIKSALFMAMRLIEPEVLDISRMLTICQEHGVNLT